MNRDAPFFFCSPILYSEIESPLRLTGYMLTILYGDYMF